MAKIDHLATRQDILMEPSRAGGEQRASGSTSGPAAAPAAAQLEGLLLRPREELDIELKSWLDLGSTEGKSTLAKAILALANHGGGYVLLGYARQPDGSYLPASNRPASIGYDQDAVNGIVQAYADPPFHCSVYNTVHPHSGQAYPIIAVPGGHKVPIQARKGSPDQKSLLNGRYYIRRHGPQSAEPASPEEWRALVMRCVRGGREELLDAMRDVLAGRPVGAPQPAEPTETEALSAWTEAGVERWRLLAKGLPSNAPGRFPFGYFRISYSVLGVSKKPSLAELRELLDRSDTRHSGWPPWWVPTRQGIAPYIENGVIECFLAGEIDGHQQSSAHSDFWRASPEGRLLLLRGYQEDDRPNKVQPGTSFDLTIPIWRLGECLLHAGAFANNLGLNHAEILLQVAWTGLAGRELVAFANPRRLVHDGYKNREQAIEQRAHITTDQISDTLPEIVYDILLPLYESFSFYQLSKRLVEVELSKMRSRQ